MSTHKEPSELSSFYDSDFIETKSHEDESRQAAMSSYPEIVETETPLTISERVTQLGKYGHHLVELRQNAQQGIYENTRSDVELAA